MMASLSSGADAPLPRGLAIAWCGAAGYVMGTAALAGILLSERFDPNGALGLLAVGLAPGLLSAAAGWLGTRIERPGLAFVVTVVASLAVSALCAPSTWILLALTGGQTQIDTMIGGDSAVGLLVLVTVIGAFVAAPLGVIFGILFALGVSLVLALRRRPSRGAIDVALAGLGAGALVVGALSADYLVEHYPTAVSWRAVEVPWPLVAVALGFATLGALAMLLGAVRLVARHGLVARARRGRARGWQVVDAGAVPGADAVPRLFPYGDATRVLVRHAAAEAGPFRSADTASAVARV